MQSKKRNNFWLYIVLKLTLIILFHKIEKKYASTNMEFTSKYSHPQTQGFKKNYFEGLNWKDHKLTIQDDTTLYFCATCIPTAVSE